MSLSKKYIYLGNIFFKYRTYIPLFFLLPLFVYVDFFPELFFKNDLKWFFISLVISFLGQSIRLLTLGYTPLGTSGRNTDRQVAKTLNTTGIYSIVRHPLYLGNYLIWIGLIVFFYNFYLIFIFSAFYYYYYQKIMYAEEAFLIKKFNDDYYKWSKDVPSFIPKFKGHIDIPSYTLSLSKSFVLVKCQFLPILKFGDS